jgi:hypothetical protein
MLAMVAGMFVRFIQNIHPADPMAAYEALRDLSPP